MIEELKKRPLIRPLLFWITGILLYTYLPIYPLFCSLGFITFMILFIVMLDSCKVKAHIGYSSRWVWGIFVSLVIVTLSVEVCHIQELKICFPNDFTASVDQKARNLQETLVLKYDRLNLTDEEKSVVATLTLGYKKSMSAEMKRYFSLTGVSHVLAVSGFHVAVVSGILSFILSVFPKYRFVQWLRVFFLISSIWTFVYITGLSPSSIRAALMFTLFLAARLLCRVHDGYNTLAAAAFLMLVYDPFYLFDIGFQLSYSAVFFIMFLAPRFESLINVRNPLLSVPWQWIVVSIAAQIGTASLCFFYFGHISLVFLYTNLPISLLTTLLMPLSLIWLMYPETLYGYDWLQNVIEFLVHAMVKTVEFFYDFPFTTLSLSFNGFHLIESSLAILLILMYLRERKPYVMLMSLFMLLIFSIHILIEVN